MKHVKVRTALLLAGCLFFGVFTPGASAQKKAWSYLLVGSYTKASEQGISVYAFDTRTGALQLRSTTGGIENPSFLCTGGKGTMLYAVSEKNSGPGSVCAYRLDRVAGRLQMINQAPSGGRGPCYVSMDTAGTHLFTANYGSGSLGIIGLRKDGSLDTVAISSIQHVGGSINKESQAGPHAHSALLSPDNRYLLSADLGNDRVYIYRYDAKAIEPLEPASPAYVTVAPGSGPRHICFHPNGQYVYVLNEISGSIDAYDYKDGVLIPKQTITLLPDGFKGIVEAADLHISTDGRFLYASNREERNELVIYSIASDGVLRFAGRQPVLGKGPRNFVIDPSGKFLLVANLGTNAVIIFRRNARTGLLAYTGKKMAVTAPACLKFAEE